MIQVLAQDDSPYSPIWVPIKYIPPQLKLKLKLWFDMDFQHIGKLMPVYMGQQPRRKPSL
jgi:hypothetical protein